jgi:hypothetical protein
MNVSSIASRSFATGFDANTSKKSDGAGTSLFAAQLADKSAALSASASTNASASAAAAKGSGTVIMDTPKGTQAIDFEAYFNPRPGSVDLDKTPLLSPSPGNIAAISQDASHRLKQLLAENGIPEAPKTIEYDSMGQMVLPDGYKYGAQFQEAVKNDVVLDRELRTVDGLSSMIVNTHDSMKYQRAYLAAGSDAARNAVNARYSHLFGGKPCTDNLVA